MQIENLQAENNSIKETETNDIDHLVRLAAGIREDIEFIKDEEVKEKLEKDIAELDEIIQDRKLRAKVNNNPN